MCKATIYDARNNFSSLVKIAEGGEPVELTRHEKPVAVIISYDDYEKLTKPKESFYDWLMKFREKNADLLDDEGIPLERDEFTAKDYEEYDEKISKLFAED